ISNLIVDQTLNNPAAITAALTNAGLGGIDRASALSAIQSAHEPHKAAAAALKAAKEAQKDADSAVEAAETTVNEVLGNPDSTSADIGAAAQAVTAATLAADDAAEAVVAADAVEQTARAERDAVVGGYGVEMHGDSLVLPNVAPDEGLSAPFNGWMTFFGQFFDHGLDLISKDRKR